MAASLLIFESLQNIFPSQYRDDVVQVYNSIPGTLVKFLQEQDVVKVINFDDNLSLPGELGTAKNETWDTFRISLRSSIASKFKIHKVQGIRPEELSDLISQEYLKACPHWAKPGENLSAIVRLNQSFRDENRRYVNANIYARITEECENNWIHTNRYKYSYYVSLDLKGIVINEARALEFGQLVSQGVPEAIELIQQKSGLTWSDFFKKLF